MKRLLILFSLCTALCARELQAQQLLDKAIREGRVDSVWCAKGLPQGFTGKDVIIGFTDWGFDYTHPVFYDSSLMRYRVLRAWDQWRQGGPTPQGFSYGSEIIGKEALLKAQCDTSNVYSYNYHGNHVASIAAGSGAGTPYRGVAPDAELLFVSFLISEQAAIDAFYWMYNVAQQEQKRLIINMSWGLYYMGNLDGTGRMADVMQELSDKGVVFVTSAGNNGNVNFHIDKEFRHTTDTLKTQITFDQSGNEHYWGQAISMTSTPGTSFRFSLTGMDRQFKPLHETPEFDTENDRTIDTFLVLGDSLHDTLFFNTNIEKATLSGGRPQVLLKIKKIPASYTLGLKVTADSGHFHAWNVAELSNGVGNWGNDFVAPQSAWTAGDNTYGIGMPASVSCALSIAAHESSYKVGAASRGGNIASFSSSGPCLNGESKPEISAPGYQLVAGISSFTDRYTGSYTKKINFEGREYGFAPLSGTSMSSPFAAGVVALMLQANPYLSSKQIKEILTSTATQDYDTRHDGILRFGYGKINAAAAVRRALQAEGSLSYTVEQSRFQVFPNPCQDEIFISCQNHGENTMAELYDLNGRRLRSYSLHTGTQCLQLSPLAQGMYLLRLRSDSASQTFKIVKRN